MLLYFIFAGLSIVIPPKQGRKMRVKELIKEIEAFRQKLSEHEELWGDSLDNTIPDYPLRNVDVLKEQSQWLTRKLGALRPYFERFFSNWIMHHPATGVKWDALEAATGLDSVAQIKGPSIQTVLQRMNQILGQLDTYDPEDEIPREPIKPIKPGIGLDRSIVAYLPNLHPYIAQGCSQLFIDNHYTQAVEEAAKAVFQYIRDKTGLSGDGASLIEAAFSLNKPVLAFSDLSDQNKKNEQLGFIEMLKGFAKGVRNPLAHTHGKQEEKQKAFEYLVMASLFCRRIDDASPEV